MTNARHNPIPSTKRRRVQRLVALAMVCAACLQVARSFVVVPLNSYLCAIPDHHHGANAETDRDHDDHATRHNEGETSFEHCKDELGGSISLAFVPVVVTGPVSFSEPDESFFILSPREPSELSGMIAPLFHPPRKNS